LISSVPSFSTAEQASLDGMIKISGLMRISQ
jgi:hypothetical protein